MVLTSKQKKLIAGSLVVIAAVGYLIFAGMKDTMVYYYTVSEVLSKGLTSNDKGMRVGGKVTQNSIKWDQDNLNLKFEMEDEKTHEKLNVEYHGTIPDTFKEGVTVIVEGKFSEQRVFLARTLLAKCPSKYEAEKAKK
ncbi:MAG: cytochrome c maturation protein CcmE [bacterium]|nr:cytochrome c maturation protein CcmE [bacterium]